MCHSSCLIFSILSLNNPIIFSYSQYYSILFLSTYKLERKHGSTNRIFLSCNYLLGHGEVFIKIVLKQIKLLINFTKAKLVQSLKPNNWLLRVFNIISNISNFPSRRERWKKCRPPPSRSSNTTKHYISSPPNPYLHIPSAAPAGVPPRPHPSRR